MPFRVFRKLQTSQIVIRTFGTYTQESISFSEDPNNVDAILCFEEGEELFQELWTEIRDEDNNQPGVDRASTLDYLNDQLVPVKVSAAFKNLASDNSVDLLATATSNFRDSLVPVFGEENKDSELFEVVAVDPVTEAQFVNRIFKCNFFGEFVIAVNLNIQTSVTNIACETRLVRNPRGANSLSGPVSCSGIITQANGNNKASMFISHPVSVGVDTEFALGFREETNVGGVVTLSNTTSQVSVYRVR